MDKKEYGERLLLQMKEQDFSAQALTHVYMAMLRLPEREHRDFLRVMTEAMEAEPSEEVFVDFVWTVAAEKTPPEQE